MVGYTQHDGRKGCFNPLEQYTTEPFIKEEEKGIGPVVRREFIELPSTEKEEPKLDALIQIEYPPLAPLSGPVVEREFIKLPSCEKEEPESFESSIEVKKLKRRRKVKESHLIS
jgi:hypothetical protein